MILVKCGCALHASERYQAHSKGMPIWLATVQDRIINQCEGASLGAQPFGAITLLCSLMAWWIPWVDPEGGWLEDRDSGTGVHCSFLGTETHKLSTTRSTHAQRIGGQARTHAADRKFRWKSQLVLSSTFPQISVPCLLCSRCPAVSKSGPQNWSTEFPKRVILCGKTRLLENATFQFPSNTRQIKSFAEGTTHTRARTHTQEHTRTNIPNHLPKSLRIS
jgi:hypothetical protein